MHQKQEQSSNGFIKHIYCRFEEESRLCTVANLDLANLDVVAFGFPAATRGRLDIINIYIKKWL